MINKKVSFDFDSTLDSGHIQHFAKKFVEKGFEVWIVTARVPDDRAPSDNWNNDLYFVADHLGISRDKIHFTSFDKKYKFFQQNEDFLFHLDDWDEDVELINKNCKNIIAIDHFEDLQWKEKLLNFLEDE